MKNQKEIIKQVIDYIEQNLYPPKTYRNIGIFIPKQNKISMCYSCMPKYYKFIAKIKEIAA